MTGHRADRLTNLVRDYQSDCGPRLAAYLDYFASLKSLDDAIRFACHGKDGKTHPHQFRVGAATLEQARKAMQRHAAQIAECKVFDELLSVVEVRTSEIDRFGELAVYDTSLRLGAHLGLLPKVVYLHAGTRQGCKALGVAIEGGTVEMGSLPSPVQELKPYEAEDFLCIYKDRFVGSSVKVQSCLPSGCR